MPTLASAAVVICFLRYSIHKFKIWLPQKEPHPDSLSAFLSARTCADQSTTSIDKGYFTISLSQTSVATSFVQAPCMRDTCEPENASSNVWNKLPRRLIPSMISVLTIAYINSTDITLI